MLAGVKDIHEGWTLLAGGISLGLDAGNKSGGVHADTPAVRSGTGSLRRQGYFSAGSGGHRFHPVFITYEEPFLPLPHLPSRSLRGPSPSEAASYKKAPGALLRLQREL